MHILFLQWIHFMDGGTENMKNLGQFAENTHDYCTEFSSYIEFQEEQVTQTAEWRGKAREHQEVIAGIILDTRSNTEIIIIIII